MNLNYKILSGVLVLALAYDAAVELVNRKRFAQLKQSLATSEETTHYLARLLDENEYELTDFDKIALSAIRK